ncbi:uncharacterized protein BT62DRAFT_695296 [Guyanagaster necrorhizus]|uniref:Uncharacterized protein n=1 Tax=Guyanagaster necrorhizus TaxID=856835 RepID=A0A9P8AKY8_9AGAR|nr:uncharacterized protein BT62DRAFT_695296 [Guyanagaster necrorhizus MCA 3950]KAG7439683.1 hypothetical protein BT62DRAFT_695296 [Guyanagaster necrorhizus MCA 3950]
MKVTEQVTAWRSNIDVVPSRTPLMHPFDSHRRMLSILNDRPYIPREAPHDAPPLDASEWDRRFLLTLLDKQRYDNRKAEEERELFWCIVTHNPLAEPNDWEDFVHSKKDDMTQHHRGSRDEPSNTIYNNTASVSPSGWTTMMPNHLYPPPPPHHQHEEYPTTHPTQPPSLALDAGYPVRSSS